MFYVSFSTLFVWESTGGRCRRECRAAAQEYRTRRSRGRICRHRQLTHHTLSQWRCTLSAARSQLSNKELIDHPSVPGWYGVVEEGLAKDLVKENENLQVRVLQPWIVAPSSTTPPGSLVVTIFCLSRFVSCETNLFFSSILFFRRICVNDP